MTWHLQAPSHYLNQWWLIYQRTYASVTRPQWVKGIHSSPQINSQFSRAIFSIRTTWFEHSSVTIHVTCLLCNLCMVKGNISKMHDFTLRWGQGVPENTHTLLSKLHSSKLHLNGSYWWNICRRGNRSIRIMEYFQSYTYISVTWLVYFDLILFYFLVFYLEHYSYQYYSYCEFYIVSTIIFDVLLPVCFMYHYLVPLFISIYVYLFIYLFIKSRGLATFLVLMVFVLHCTDYK